MKLHVVVRVKDGKKKAFHAGFWKGLGAAAMLYSDQQVDPDIGDFKPKPLPKRSLGNPGDDWKAVGSDLRNAVKAQ